MNLSNPKTPALVSADAEALARCRGLVRELDAWAGMACRFPQGGAEAFSVAAQLLQHAIDGTDPIETRIRSSIILMKGRSKKCPPS